MGQALDPVAVFMNAFRTVAMFVFIVLMIVLFFSLKVTILNDDLQRFNMELSDALSGTKLASDRSVFSAAELNNLEATTNEIELYARECDYGYVVEIESLSKGAYCENNEPCSDFCNSACGTGSECQCNREIFSNNFCECKKGDEWISKYQWKFGDVQENAFYEKSSSSFPASIDTGKEIVPAALKLTTYDSLLTRLSCATQKAYETKKSTKIEFSITNIPQIVAYRDTIIFHRTDSDGTHVCLYQKDVYGNDAPVQCRYMPDIPFEELRQENIGSINPRPKEIIAYPMKTEEAECPPKDYDIATSEDEVATVILCMK